MGLLLGLWLLLAPAKPVELKVYHNLMAPTDVKMIVRVDPHPDNRALILVLDGPYYTLSANELDGENAPKIQERWFKGVRAPGWYVLRAVVRRSGGQDFVASYEFCLRGGEETCERSRP